MQHALSFTRAQWQQWLIEHALPSTHSKAILQGIFQKQLLKERCLITYRNKLTIHLVKQNFLLTQN